MKNRIILSISSDIGAALAKDWLSKGYKVYGTYNNFNKDCAELKKNGAKIIKLNLLHKKSFKNFFNIFTKKQKWDAVVLAAGTQEPIGNFEKNNFDDWEKSLLINFTAQLRFLHQLLPYRNFKKNLPKVLFFAGGGTNNANLSYSAYTIAKIASIKICELLDAEISDTSFSILGPGWVKTKIHKSTLNAKTMAGSNYKKTIYMLNSKKCYPMEKVIECCNWLMDSPKSLISGRNFSAVFDPWESKKINKILKDNNNFKLRRYGNELFK